QDLLDLRRHYHHSGAVRREPVDEAMDLHFGAHIDSAGWLIEKVDASSRQQPSPENHFLLIAAAQCGDRLVHGCQLDAHIANGTLDALLKPHRPQQHMSMARKPEVER